jgi:hypothetical protein
MLESLYWSIIVLQIVILVQMWRTNRHQRRINASQTRINNSTFESIETMRKRIDRLEGKRRLVPVDENEDVW